MGIYKAANDFWKQSLHPALDAFAKQADGYHIPMSKIFDDTIALSSDPRLYGACALTLALWNDTPATIFGIVVGLCGTGVYDCLSSSDNKLVSSWFDSIEPGNSVFNSIVDRVRKLEDEDQRVLMIGIILFATWTSTYAAVVTGMTLGNFVWHHYQSREAQGNLTPGNGQVLGYGPAHLPGNTAKVVYVNSA